jgi:hypothetical protein
VSRARPSSAAVVSGVVRRMGSPEVVVVLPDV